MGNESVSVGRWGGGGNVGEGHESDSEDVVGGELDIKDFEIGADGVCFEVEAEGDVRDRDGDGDWEVEEEEEEEEE